LKYLFELTPIPPIPPDDRFEIASVQVLLEQAGPILRLVR
jgi:hypothetical protein